MNKTHKQTNKIIVNAAQVAKQVLVQPNAATPTYAQNKLAVDVHAGSIVAVRNCFFPTPTGNGQD